MELIELIKCIISCIFLYYSHYSFLMSEIDWFEHATRILLKYSSTFIVIGSLMWYTVKSTPFLQKEY